MPTPDNMQRGLYYCNNTNVKQTWLLMPSQTQPALRTGQASLALHTVATWRSMCAGFLWPHGGSNGALLALLRPASQQPLFVPLGTG